MTPTLPYTRQTRAVTQCVNVDPTRQGLPLVEGLTLPLSGEGTIYHHSL